MNILRYFDLDLIPDEATLGVRKTREKRIKMVKEFFLSIISIIRGNGECAGSGTTRTPPALPNY